jgi:D-beta-D-heptose 7-phosphate kinase/D-beta-D-heptose 1-phosphate adenosyltransferase
VNRPRAQALLRAMEGRRVLVVGDVMLDEFLWGDVTRISPEAPVPVVTVREQSFRLGGAGNVAVNVRALGGEALLAGVVGSDAAGSRVQGALDQAGIVPLLALSETRPTTLKTRIIANHQQVVRADRETDAALDPALVERLLEPLAAAVAGAGAVVVSDYAKGVVSRAVMRRVLEAARRRRVPVLVDPKVPHLPLYRGASVITPNLREAERATRIDIRSPRDLQAAGRRLLSSLRCRAALITRGESGMTLFEPRRRPFHIPATAREVFDVTGAGDTVVASLALALAAGARLTEAAVLANAAAGVVVGKVGTAQVSPAEVLEALEA